MTKKTEAIMKKIRAESGNKELQTRIMAGVYAFQYGTDEEKEIIRAYIDGERDQMNIIYAKYGPALQNIAAGLRDHRREV